ncbi:hypothetical protein KCU61_g685, partial [Aureobasidium melanogenum]
MSAYCKACSTCLTHQTWIRASPVNSGWKLVPNTLPCLTATISPSSPTSLAVVLLSFSAFARPGKRAIISTVPIDFPLDAAFEGATTNLLNNRGSDKDTAEWLIAGSKGLTTRVDQEGQIQRRLKALDLTTKVVAVDTHI